jgi:hypothetical protein
MTSIADRHVCIIATQCSTAALSACMTTVVCKLCDAEREAKLKFVHLVPSGGYMFLEKSTLHWFCLVVNSAFIHWMHRGSQ